MFCVRDDGLSTHSWLKLMNFARAVFRFPAKRLSRSLVDDAPRTREADSSINFATFSALLLHVAVANAWILAKQSHTETLSVLEPEFCRVVSGIKSNPEILARFEVANHFSQPHVHAIFKDATATLARIWTGPTSSHAIGITQDRFVQVLKESKCIDKHCTIDSAKRVFALFVDSELSLMTFEEFGKSLLAVALWKDSSPLSHSAIKLKRLIDELANRAVKH
jgi:hypothetical protein